LPHELSWQEINSHAKGSWKQGLTIRENIYQSAQNIDNELKICSILIM
jgi:hypothetical protein